MQAESMQAGSMQAGLPRTDLLHRKDMPRSKADQDAAQQAGAAPQRRRISLRLLPILACLLFHFPLILQGSEGWSTAWIGLYLFGVWALLIGLVAILSRADPLGDDGPETGKAP
jgi:hypothetical protein